MSILGGFFESVEVAGTPDRSYSSIQYAGRWKRFIRDGISVEEQEVISDQNEVSLNTGTMTTQVALGNGFVQGYDYYMDAVVNVPHSVGDPTNPRIDRVVIESNIEADVRAFSIKVVEGAPDASPTPPALTRDVEVWQLSLAQVLIPAGVAIIDSATITDERSDDTVCGLANVMIGIKPPVVPAGDSAENISIADENQVYSSDRVEGALLELGSSIQGVASISTTITETSPTITTIDTLASGVLFTRVTITETSSIITTVNNKIYEADGVTIKFEYNDVITEVSGTETSIVRTVA